jgi:hypothetical protein
MGHKTLHWKLKMQLEEPPKKRRRTPVKNTANRWFIFYRFHWSVLYIGDYPFLLFILDDG